MALFDFLFGSAPEATGTAAPLTGGGSSALGVAKKPSIVVPKKAVTAVAKASTPDIPPVQKISTKSSASVAPVTGLGSSVSTKAPVPRVTRMIKADPIAINYLRNGRVDDSILNSGDVQRIADAVVHNGTLTAIKANKPLASEPSLLNRMLLGVGQAGSQIVGDLGTTSETLFNLVPGMNVRSPAPEADMVAYERFLRDYAPDRLAEFQTKRIMAGELPATRAIASAVGTLAETAVLAPAVTGGLSNLPFMQKLKGAGEAGINLYHVINNAAVDATISTLMGSKEGKPSDIPKLMLSNAAFLLPATSYPALAVAGAASYFLNRVAGFSTPDALINTTLGMVTARIQGKGVLGELQLYRKGAFTDAVNTIMESLHGRNIPAAVRETAVQEAEAVRNYFEQNPNDYKGLYEMMLGAERRILQYSKQYAKPSATGEQRLIGVKGATQGEPPLLPPPEEPTGGIPKQEVAPVKRTEVEVTAPKKPLAVEGSQKVPLPTESSVTPSTRQLQLPLLEAPPTPLREAQQRQLQVSTGGGGAESLDIIIKTSPTPVNQKVNILDYLATPSKVLKKIGLEKEATLLRTQYDKYLDELPVEIERIAAWEKIAGSDAQSSQMIFRVLNGDENINTLSKDQQMVAGQIQAYLKSWADKLGLPEERRITNYITHIFGYGSEGREFDEELAKLITGKVAGSVYDPFLKKRIGVEGFREDVWAALEAYTKRAVRKVNMDVALQEVEKKSNKLEQSQYDYVRRYVDRINMRPTELDNLTDNFVKSIIGYRLGARPTNVATKTVRRVISRGALGLNIGSTLKNLTQGVNTYAKLGEKYTLKGYIQAAKYFASGKTDPDVASLLRESFVQDRMISAMRKKMQAIDKALYINWDLTEKINRVPAYFGAKAKYLAEHPKATEKEASDYAKKLVRDTQFSFDSIDLPVGLGSDIAKTLAQFQTYTLKQGEMLAGMVKNKEIAGLARYAAATAFLLFTVGKALGLTWKDYVPGMRLLDQGFTPTPIKIAKDTYDVATNAPNQFGQTKKVGVIERAKQSSALKSDAALLVPAGTQIKKTLEGAQSVATGKVKSSTGKSTLFKVSQDPLNIIRALIFGKYGTKEGRKYIDKLNGQTEKETNSLLKDLKLPTIPQLKNIPQIKIPKF